VLPFIPTTSVPLSLIIRNNYINLFIYVLKPVTVAERSKACTVFARLEAGTLGSNPSEHGCLVCVCVCVCMCVRFSVFVYR
jgi:hypothetical protein